MIKRPGWNWRIKIKAGIGPRTSASVGDAEIPNMTAEEMFEWSLGKFIGRSYLARPQDGPDAYRSDRFDLDGGFPEL